jgi:hypothetical protein
MMEGQHARRDGVSHPRAPAGHAPARRLEPRPSCRSSHYRSGGVAGPVGPVRSVQCDTQVESPPQLSTHGDML